MLPFTVVNVIFFIAHLFGRGLTPLTVVAQASALAFVHKINGLADPVLSSVVEKMLQGFRKVAGGADLRLPVTADLVVRICLKMDDVWKDSFECSMMKSLVTMAFFLFFRLGELVQRGRVVVGGVEFTD